jgi:hypothetical protein
MSKKIELMKVTGEMVETIKANTKYRIILDESHLNSGTSEGIKHMRRQIDQEGRDNTKER